GSAEHRLMGLRAEEHGDALAHQLEGEDLAVAAPAAGEQADGVAVEVDHLAEEGQAEAAAQLGGEGGRGGGQGAGSGHVCTSTLDCTGTEVFGFSTRPRRTKSA